jgi:hypothetical protein
MKSDTLWTGNRKDAYEIAKLLNVVEGVENVFVSVTSDAFQFRIFFQINDDVHEHSTHVELVHLLKEYQLNSINFQGERWDRAKKEVFGS